IVNGVSSTAQIDNLAPGMYYVYEYLSGNPDNVTLVTPNGVQVTVTADETAEIPTVEFTNDVEAVGSLKITKNVTVNGEPAAEYSDPTAADGTYTFYVEDESGNEVARRNITIVNGVSNTAQIDNLKPGAYYVYEYLAGNPDGVTLATANGIKVIVTANNTAEISTAEFTNDYTATGSLTLKATKSMARTDIELGTFEFELKDADGSVIGTATNDAAGTITFETLNYTMDDAGKTYTYTVSEKSQTGTGYFYDTTVYTVTVTVTDNGDGTLAVTATVAGGTAAETAYTDTALTFTNDITSVKVSKVDATTLEELAGATIQILDKDGNVVDEWVSTTETHETTGLVPGETYTLHETAAPNGYDITADTTFILNEDGTIDTGSTTAAISSDGVLFVKDTMTVSETAEISVTKNLQQDNGDELFAVDDTYYAGLYTDAECTNLYAMKAIEFKNASASTVVFTDLEIGRTYYIAECDENGTALVSGIEVLADGTKYAPNFGDNAVTTTVTVTDGSQTVVTFTNEFYTMPKNYYKEGTLTITKKLLGADGSALNSNETFYAGIFTDASYTTLAATTGDANVTGVDQNIVALSLGGNSEVSATVGVSIGSGDTVTLYVTEVDADGNPVDGAEGFAYTVTMDGSVVTLDETNTTASVTITNQEIEETSEEESEEVSEESETETTAVQTGDETPILPYMLVMLAALLVMLAGVLERKRRNA
ncbi:MAG: hypothetical protein LUI14_06850, partial [Lachnospiraceae bacterium]|nr:hypothetical protein [Lachnospiraceae bacterium]